VYAKIFSQIHDSTIAEDWQRRLVFMDLLILADRTGAVDMPVEAIARRTNVPIEIIEAAICALCKPDDKSRSPGARGARLVPLDPERDWGWQIVNFAAYHSMRDENARREYMRGYMRKKREGGKAPPLSEADAKAPISPPKLAEEKPIAVEAGPGNKPVARRRKPDEIWDALCAALKLQPTARRECKRIGGIVRDLKLKGATPAQIAQRAAEYRSRWPTMTLTPEALLKHWDYFGVPEIDPISRLAKMMKDEDK